MTAIAILQTDPFPHALITDRWDTDQLRAVRDEFPPYDDPRWTTYNDPQERGKKAGGQNMWGPTTKEFIRLLRSVDVCAELEALTGIAPLTADLIGGGMHITGPDGRLGMHTDFSVHPSLPGLRRRLNLLVFLEEGWNPAWGGTLYLGENRDVGFLPLLNHTVLFETSATSWHGHPEPIRGEHYRRSIAVYYFAPERPGEEGALGTTIWLNP